jgi:hypothetical protein
LAAIDDLEEPPDRRLRLTSIRGVRRELAAVYHEARVRKSLDWQDASRAAMILQILGKMIEGQDIERQIADIAAAMAAAGITVPKLPRGNGRWEARP